MEEDPLYTLSCLIVRPYLTIFATRLLRQARLSRHGAAVKLVRSLLQNICLLRLCSHSLAVDDAANTALGPVRRLAPTPVRIAVDPGVALNILQIMFGAIGKSRSSTLGHQPNGPNRNARCIRTPEAQPCDVPLWAPVPMSRCRKAR